MPLIVFHTKRVREALGNPMSWGIELVFLALVGCALGMLVMMGKQVSAPLQQTVTIDLSLWALPKYTLLTLCRGFFAYGLSLAFTLIYGTIAAHDHRAERVMIPALDVGQSIPVLGFLPAVQLAMIGLFPSRELGLEITCVILIFTAQVWNMTFSFHGSLRAIPTPLREVSTLNGLTGWQIFRLLEVPAAMIGLVWNSMMSMAGGWFFLTVNEAFTLKGHDYRLPGIGSYMNEAINQDRVDKQWAAVVAMMVMIVATDQFFWRPIVVWSQRFKMEDQADADKAQSWLLDVLQKSRIFQWVSGRFHTKDKSLVRIGAPLAEPSAGKKATFKVVKWLCLGIGGLGALYGALSLIGLLFSLPIHAPNGQDWVHVIGALGASFLRVAAAVLLGAAWTLPVGIMIGRNARWAQRLQPIIQVMASFPAPMVFPIVTGLLVLLGIPFTIGCTALLLLGAQWYILFNVIAGAMAIPGELKEVSSVYRSSRWQVWTRLYLPSVFPYLITGLVTAAGGAWNATIVSEYVQLPHGGLKIAFGLGSLISEATTDGNYPLLAAGVVIMAFSVVMLNRLIWKRLYHLAENRYSLNV